MRRIICLSIFLLILIIVSVFINVEHFLYNFDINFKGTPNTPDKPNIPTNSEPKESDLEKNKIKVRLFNNFDTQIKIYMRSNNNAFNGNNIHSTQPLTSCRELFGNHCYDDTMVVDIDKQKFIDLSFDINAKILSASIWMIKVDNNTNGKNVSSEVSFFDKAAEGPMGFSSFEFNYNNKQFYYNISYVEGLSYNINTALYKDFITDPILSSCNLNKKPDSLKDELKVYKYLGMNRILSSKYNPKISDCQRSVEKVCEINDAKYLNSDNQDSNTEYDACGDNKGLSNIEKHKCRTHIAKKTIDGNTYCGYLFNQKCPYCWAYGEQVCIDPDTFNNTEGTFEDKFFAAGKGDKAKYCGYNDDATEYHFNWPKIGDIEDTTTGTDNDESTGVKEGTGKNGKKYWYNTTKDCKSETEQDIFNNCYKPFDTPLNKHLEGIHINVGGLEASSLSTETINNDQAVLLNVIFNKIDWLESAQ